MTLDLGRVIMSHIKDPEVIELIRVSNTIWLLLHVLSGTCTTLFLQISVYTPTLRFTGWLYIWLGNAFLPIKPCRRPGRAGRICEDTIIALSLLMVFSQLTVLIFLITLLTFYHCRLKSVYFSVDFTRLLKFILHYLLLRVLGIILSHCGWNSLLSLFGSLWLFWLSSFCILWLLPWDLMVIVHSWLRLWLFSAHSWLRLWLISAHR